MITTGYSDTFGRTVASGLGTATSGQAYTLNGVASQFSVAPNTAQIAIASAGEKFGYIDFKTQDIDVTGQVALSGIPATNLATAGFVAKLSNTSNYFVGSMMVATGGAVSLRFSKLVAGSLVTISTTAVAGLTYVANTFYNLRYQIYWSRLLQTNVMSLKLWAVGATQPGGWMATASDASFTDYTAGTGAGIHGRDESSVAGTITTKYRSVLATSYNLPVPASTDTMCAAVQPSIAADCSIAVADGNFESGNPAGDGWYVQNGTLAADSTLPESGSWCALLTASGSGQLILRNNLTVAAVPGDVVTAGMWVRSSVSTNVLAVIDYYAAANAYISSDSVSYPVIANVWTFISSKGLGAPATTVRAEYGPTIFGPAAGNLLRADGVTITKPCTVPGVLYPAETALQALADAVDTAMTTFDPLVDLAGLFPRVRISNSNLLLNTALFPPLTFSAVEFNVGTDTNLGYDNTSLYLPIGIWLLTFEIRLAGAASNFIQLSFSGGPSVGQIVTDMRSNPNASNDAGTGGTAHVSALTYSTDPTTPIKISMAFFANNSATTYTVQYMALSAIKISDYFA